MEKIKFNVLLLGIVFLFTACGIAVNPTLTVVDSLPNKIGGRVDTHGYFQDYTDYGEFTFSGITAETLEQNPYFSPVTQERIHSLYGYLDNFEGWLEDARDCEDCEIWEHYGFSKNFIREGDYFYLKMKGHNSGPYDNYDLYYFSLEKQTLYFFHNNI